MLTVVTPASTFALAEAATIIAELGDATIDANLITRLIDGQSKRISTYCNRVLARETVAETIRFDCVQDRLILARFPIASVTSIVENGVTLTAADYELDKETGVAIRVTDDDIPTTWPTGKIVVTYVAGFLLPGQASRNLPIDIERACMDLVKRAYFTVSQDTAIRADEVEGIGRTEYFSGATIALPADIEALLSGYRLAAI